VRCRTPAGDQRGLRAARPLIGETRPGHQSPRAEGCRAALFAVNNPEFRRDLDLLHQRAESILAWNLDFSRGDYRPLLLLRRSSGAAWWPISELHVTLAKKMANAIVASPYFDFAKQRTGQIPLTTFTGTKTDQKSQEPITIADAYAPPSAPAISLQAGRTPRGCR
jgi:hypothetical protein